MQTTNRKIVANIVIENGVLRAVAPGARFDAYNGAIRAVPGRVFDPKARLWYAPATPICAKEMAERFAASGFKIRLDSDTANLITEADRLRSLIETGIGGDWSCSSDRPDHVPPLRPHQRIGATMIMGSRSSYLAWEMGTGKSKAVIEAVCTIYARRVLIVCPKSVVPHWPREFARHGWGGRQILALMRKPGRKGLMTVRERAEILEIALRQSHPLVVIVNYDSVWRDPLGKLIYGAEWDVVVADEAQRIKDPHGKCSKWFEGFRDQAKRRIALSGTPIQSTPLDLFAQCRWLDPGVFGSSLGAFKQLYAIEGSHHEVVAWRNLESMQARFRMISHRVKVKEVLDLPEFRDQTIEVELGDEARSLYDEVEESFVAHVEAGTITVTNALTELLRLQQIASGAARFDGSDDVKVIDTAKEDALVELFDSLPPNEPVVVFCIFRFELDMVHRAAVAAERRSAELSGRRNDLDEWQRGEDGKTVIAVQIQAGGLGIDLTRACYSVYLSTGFSYGTVEQSRARTNRMGQTRPGLFIRIAARDTVDQMVERALAKKRRQASKVVDKRVEDNLVFDLMDMIKRGGDEDGERS